MTRRIPTARALPLGALVVLVVVSSWTVATACADEEEAGTEVVFREEIVERGLLPLELVRVRDAAGAPLGELVVVQRLENLQQSSATIAVVATNDGSRAELVYRLDPKEGLVTTTFTDLASGWSAEMEHDLGVSNLGTVEEHGSTERWAENVEHRLRTQHPPSSFTLTTTDGIAVRWSTRPGEPGAADGALKEAKVELASQMLGVELPATVSAELAVLATVLQAPGSDRLRDFDSLLDPLLAALELAEVRGVSHAEGEVAHLDPRAHAEEVRGLLPKSGQGSER